MAGSDSGIRLHDKDPDAGGGIRRGESVVDLIPASTGAEESAGKKAVTSVHQDTVPTTEYKPVPARHQAPPQFAYQYLTSVPTGFFLSF